MTNMDNINIVLHSGNNGSTNQSNSSACVDGIQWIFSITGDCCVTTREQVSAYLGLASICLWSFVGIPQLCKNMCHLAGMVGLSVLLILQWVGGDLTNLIGCILTKQNKFQVFLAIYFVVLDVFLLLQYVYYICWRKQNRNKGNIPPSPKLAMCLMGIFVMSTTLIHNHLGSTSSYDVKVDYESHLHRQTRTLLSLPSDKPGGNLFWQDPKNIIGYCLGVVSALFYLGSRVSQIYSNVRAQSTAGLSFLTFILAILGNLTYGGQIIILDWSRDYVVERLPWLLGSFGVVLLDCGILVQFTRYKHNVLMITEEQESLLTREYLINADDTVDESERVENTNSN
ncbi:lysosomal amino acid transporter 1 homolog [Biomphalaria glabrata]|uniref:Lysosomal amino acid transporter 1 homolog n=1 Tax=Biomphalaria glabrata TaxID=6526 RepID=A0A9W2YN37_BIOGL|nr:lysosomal amino acid transporter 1 homolog [Biomphalaria glabrata]XP_055864199.1 lysosomal amino acid transporter 1 homolog [Biomphalaria glabrata]XP_055864200.1 lysosomal amino acid transporter 1 homolog [Biomphalaria glabrata]XP_055864201.1 lysosomal amino acid transporter 1 homolog [Biomphalaria glabrata]